MKDNDRLIDAILDLGLEMKAMRKQQEETNQRLDQTNQQLDQTIKRLDRIEKQLIKNNYAINELQLS